MDTLYIRLNSGFELTVQRQGAEIGDVCEPGMYTVSIHRYGVEVHETDAFLRLQPATHLDVARSAVMFYKAAGVIAADAQEV